MFPILNPPPSSLPIPSLCVVPVHQPQASSIMHQTWTGNSFHTWYYTCFNAILPNLPTLSLSNRVHKTVLYIGVSVIIILTFIHVVGVCQWFVSLHQISIVWIQDRLSVRLPVDGYLSCCQFCDITSKAAVNIHVAVFTWIHAFHFCKNTEG